MTKIHPNSVSQDLLKTLANFDTDGKKGITNQTERDAAQKLLDHFQGKDNEYVQQLINEYDLQVYEQQASKDFVKKMKNLLNFDNRGNKSEIDKGDELNMLNTLINTAVGPDKAYAEAFKRVYLSEAGTLAEQNAELRNENMNLKEENEVLRMKLTETLSKSKTTKQSVNNAKESMKNIMDSTPNISENAKNCIEKVSGFANDISKNCENIEGIANKVTNATESFEQGKMTEATLKKLTTEANTMLKTKFKEIENKHKEIEKNIKEFEDKIKNSNEQFSQDTSIAEKLKLAFGILGKNSNKVPRRSSNSNNADAFGFPQKPINKFED